MGIFGDAACQCGSNLRFGGPLTPKETTREQATEFLSKAPACCMPPDCCEGGHKMMEKGEVRSTLLCTGCGAAYHLALPFEDWFRLGRGEAADPPAPCPCGGGSPYEDCCRMEFERQAERRERGGGGGKLHLVGRKGCKKCHGRGILGVAEGGRPVVCPCAIKGLVHGRG